LQRLALHSSQASITLPAHAPQAALDLPLKVLVQQREDGRTVIVYHPVISLLGRSGVDPDLAARLEPAQRLLIRAITG
jgi:uncharacterized protein (DUF302 family)